MDKSETLQKFGGNWTEEKLNIFTRYLEAYLIALQKQRFGKVYIDAFAGTGEIETRDGEQCLIGSAKRALAAERKFDQYYFIERSE
jgi:three-Cys-motif partner protein